ncbi:MAG: AzlD domain-containing protein [Bifidobacteriaceae bacterium]|nr:AzlD domain-containing protein [Bifidobacteriaceae bacterium]
MSNAAIWGTVLAGSGVCLVLKLVGAYVPQSWLGGERTGRVMGLVTVSLLAALLVVQAVGNGQGLTADSRLIAVAVAGLALWLRAPFIVVVIIAAAVAAGLRALGFP